MVGKFFLITCLGVDSAMVSFDTYKYYKEKANVEDKSNQIGFRNIIKEYLNEAKLHIQIYNDISLLIGEIKKYIQIHGPEIFLEKFSLHSNENSKFWSLFYTCDDLGIKVGSYKEKFDNTTFHKSDLSVNINNVMSDYFNKKKYDKKR